MTQLSAIIHLGAGRGRELDEYLAAKPERIVLVEADPVAAQQLARRTAHLPQVEVVAVAIAPAGSRAVLNIFNLAAFSSLRVPTGLREMFPGLRLSREVEVDALSPVELVEISGLAPDRSNWLVIDVPGEEAEVLEALQQAGMLHLFDRVVLHCGRVALYEGGRDAEQLLRLLEDKGFEVVSCEAEMDPDRPCWVLQKNLLKIENRELRSQVEQLQKAKAEQAKLATERQAKLDELSKSLDEQSRHLLELKTQLDQATRAKAEQAKLATERQAKLDELSKSLDEQSRHLSELKTQLDQATRAKAEQAKLATERQSRIKQLESTLAEFESRQGLLAEEMARAEGQIDLIKDVLLREPGL
ncbi:hypothetical protein ACHHRT_11135 [Desulfurivibrio sp. D14AmB]|uniref:hypothetical protein n=1 Tax=Desulfurivibrio sp. D14AmB TaxID=3374370 RepID=UPI00376ECD35